MSERTGTTPSGIWSAPLTDGEREIIANLEGAPSWLIWRWLNHVLRCYDGLVASIEEPTS